MSHDAWIEQSLARLEQLEAQKAQYQHAGQPAPAELDAEIATLYETLEAVAGDGEAEPAPVPQPAAAAHAWAAAPAPFGNAPDNPFAAPPPPATPVAEPVMQAQPAGAPAMHVMAPDPGMGMDFDDGDLRPARSKAPMLLGALLVAGLGGGGWYVMQQQAEAAAPAPEPTGEAKVIGASEIPEDTQEPDVAQGGSADRTPGTIWKKSSRPQPKRSGSRRSSRKRSSPKEADKGRKVEIGGNNRDPLSGLD